MASTMTSSVITASDDLLRLKSLISKKAFLRRKPPEEPFDLASGGTSWVYFDCKPVTQDPEALNLIAKLIFSKIKGYDLDAIGGLESGAIPIATAVALYSYQAGKQIPSFWVRQTPKEHGTKNWIEGTLKPNSKVVIIDDVTTKGGSVDKALQKLQELRCKIVEIISMVDREEGARERFEKKGLNFSCLFKMSEFTSSDQLDIQVGVQARRPHITG